MPLLDFKLLLWIKQMLKSVSEKHLAQCLTSAFLWDLWLALLTHSVEKWAIELFEFEGKTSQILPLWFCFACGGLDNLSYHSGGPGNRNTSFHIPWRSLAVLPMVLISLCTWKSSLSSRALDLQPSTSSVLPLRLQAVFCNSWISTKFSLCPAESL